LARFLNVNNMKKKKPKGDLGKIWENVLSVFTL